MPLTGQEAALVHVDRLLRTLGVPYMVIGGQANIIWGEPRATLDIDVTVWVADDALASTIDQVCVSLQSMVERPGAFVVENRVLPLRTDHGIRIDMIFGLLPFEQEAIARGVTREIAGHAVRYCTAEDLILHKILSERPRDLEDARGVTLRQGASLDLAYLEPRIQELARELDEPGILERWDGWLREARRGS